MLLLSYLGDLLDRQTQAFVCDSLSVKCFLGLAVDETWPGHSTLTTFKGRIEKRGRERNLFELMAEILRRARRDGVEFGATWVVDSTHTEPDLDVKQGDRRQWCERKGSRDNGARRGVNHNRWHRQARGQVLR